MKETSWFRSCPDSITLSWSWWRWQEFNVNPIRFVLLVAQVQSAANAKMSKAHLQESDLNCLGKFFPFKLTCQGYEDPHTPEQS